jgi:hypothetical protein
MTDSRIPTITDSLTNAARRANILATEADSTQLAELALIVARIAHETAAISRATLANGTVQGGLKGGAA